MVAQPQQLLLNLAYSYWQIRVHPKSRDKTAFIMPQGLYEFIVMPPFSEADATGQHTLMISLCFHELQKNIGNI